MVWLFESPGVKRSRSGIGENGFRFNGREGSVSRSLSPLPRDFVIANLVGHTCGRPWNLSREMGIGCSFVFRLAQSTCDGI
jgi:hypothetical protein